MIHRGVPVTSLHVCFNDSTKDDMSVGVVVLPLPPPLYCFRVYFAFTQASERSAANRLLQQLNYKIFASPLRTIGNQLRRRCDFFSDFHDPAIAFVRRTATPRNTASVGHLRPLLRARRASGETTACTGGRSRASCVRRRKKRHKNRRADGERLCQVPTTADGRVRRSSSFLLKNMDKHAGATER